jgi:hypothetical protein
MLHPEPEPRDNAPRCIRGVLGGASLESALDCYANEAAQRSSGASGRSANRIDQTATVVL